MESSFELDTETLDNLYKHQLEELKLLTLRLDDTQDINLCRKWLQIFNKTSEDEKVARNCLSALLCQQLKNEGYLSMPFTDLSNCNRDLNQVLGALDQSFSNNSQALLLSTGESSFRGQNDTFQAQEREIVQLKEDLKRMQLERDENEIKVRELIRIIENCNRCELENDILKKISDLLDSLRKGERVESFPIFSKLFADEDNTYLHKKLAELDKAFQLILQENTKSKLIETRKQLTKVIRSRGKLLKKYEDDLRIQKWEQKMRLKVIKLKFSSILSRVYLKSRENSQSEMIDLFNQLEEKYKRILLQFYN